MPNPRVTQHRDGTMGRASRLLSEQDRRENRSLSCISVPPAHRQDVEDRILAHQRRVEADMQRMAEAEAAIKQKVHRQMKRAKELRMAQRGRKASPTSRASALASAAIPIVSNTDDAVDRVDFESGRGLHATSLPLATAKELAGDDTYDERLQRIAAHSERVAQEDPETSETPAKRKERAYKCDALRRQMESVLLARGVPMSSAELAAACGVTSQQISNAAQTARGRIFSVRTPSRKWRLAPAVIAASGKAG